MKAETRYPGQRLDATMRMPANLDEMTVAEFLDYVRWWARLQSTDRQLLLKEQRRH